LRGVFMEREVAFARILGDVKKKAREQGGVISRQEVREAFAELFLEESQFSLIFDYLEKSGIGVGKPARPGKALSRADRNYLSMYLRDLSHLEQVSQGEKEAITLSAMAGDAAAKRRLLTLYLPQVVDVARLYAGQGVILEDLIGEGNVALAMGVEMLGALEHAWEVEGMLGRLMMEAMEESIATNSRLGEIGRQAAERVNRVADAARELSEALLRKVTAEELAAESEIALEEIQEALRLSARKIEDIRTEETDGSGKSGF